MLNEREGHIDPALERLPLEIVLFRPYTKLDAAAVLDMIDDPTVARYTAGVPQSPSLKWVQDLLALQDPENPSMFGLFFGHQLIAGASWKSASDERIFISYLVHREKRGQGIAKEAIKALTTYLKGKFPHLEALYADVMQDNTPSIKLLEKLGFTREAISTCPSVGRGKQVPAFRFKLVVSECV